MGSKYIVWSPETRQRLSDYLKEKNCPPSTYKCQALLFEGQRELLPKEQHRKTFSDVELKRFVNAVHPGKYEVSPAQPKAPYVPKVVEVKQMLVERIEDRIKAEKDLENRVHSLESQLTGLQATIDKLSERLLSAEKIITHLGSTGLPATAPEKVTHDMKPRKAKRHILVVGVIPKYRSAIEEALPDWKVKWTEPGDSFQDIRRKTTGCRVLLCTLGVDHKILTHVRGFASHYYQCSTPNMVVDVLKHLPEDN